MRTWRRFKSKVETLLFAFVFCSVLAPAVTLSMATVITLPELIAESPLIVYGHIEPTAPNSPSGWLRFRVTGVEKGESSIRDGAVSLCNSRPNTEWPDLSKLTGDAVLFLVQSPSKECFNLSHNYRSVIRIRGDLVDTLVIKGQPESQSLEQFLARIRSLASNAK